MATHNHFSQFGKAFGQLLLHAREESGFTRKELEDKLGVSLPTIKGLESGNLLPSYKNILPIYDAIGTRFDWRRYQSITLALQILKASDDLSGLHAFLKKEDPELLEIFETSQAKNILVKMRHYLTKRESSEPHSPHSKSTPLVAELQRLPPIYRDMVEGLTRQLGEFPPHVNTTAFDKWEKDNKDRIVEAYGIVSDHRTLTTANGFSWPYLRNGNESAKVTILIYGEKSGLAHEKSFETLITELKKRPKNPDENKINTAKIRAIFITDEVLKSELSRILHFDLVGRGGCTREEISASKDNGTIVEFFNMWIFSLRSNLDGGASGNNLDVAFLDNYSKDGKLPHYAVSTSHKHTQDALDTCKAIKHVKHTNVFKGLTSIDWPSLDGTTEEAILVVSLDSLNKYFSFAEHVHRYFSIYFSTVHYLLGDYYYERTQQRIFGRTESQAKNDTEAKCSEFSRTISKYIENPSIIRASEIRGNDEFKNRLKLIHNLHMSNTELQQALQADAEAYVNRQRNRGENIIPEAQALSESKAYILDEIATYSILISYFGIKIELYPGEELRCIQSIMQNSQLGSETFLGKKVTVQYEVRR